MERHPWRISRHSSCIKYCNGLTPELDLDDDDGDVEIVEKQFRWDDGGLAIDKNTLEAPTYTEDDFSGRRVRVDAGSAVF